MKRFFAVIVTTLITTTIGLSACGKPLDTPSTPTASTHTALSPTPIEDNEKMVVTNRYRVALKLTLPKGVFSYHDSGEYSPTITLKHLTQNYSIIGNFVTADDSNIESMFNSPTSTNKKRLDGELPGYEWTSGKQKQIYLRLREQQDGSLPLYFFLEFNLTNDLSRSIDEIADRQENKEVLSSIAIDSSYRFPDQTGVTSSDGVITVKFLPKPSTFGQNIIQREIVTSSSATVTSSQGSFLASVAFQGHPGKDPAAIASEIHTKTPTMHQPPIEKTIADIPVTYLPSSAARHTGYAFFIKDNVVVSAQIQSFGNGPQLSEWLFKTMVDNLVINQRYVPYLK